MANYSKPSIYRASWVKGEMQRYIALYSKSNLHLHQLAIWRNLFEHGKLDTRKIDAW